MKIEIWHNPRCSKSRMAKSVLDEKGVTYTTKEYLKKIPTKEELRIVLSQLNMPAESLVRKSESIYKEQFKGKSLSEDEWIDAFIRYPKLIERPIVIKDNKAVIGRPTENVDDLLAS